MGCLLLCFVREVSETAEHTPGSDHQPAHGLALATLSLGSQLLDSPPPGGAWHEPFQQKTPLRTFLSCFKFNFVFFFFQKNSQSSILKKYFPWGCLKA